MSRFSNPVPYALDINGNTTVGAKLYFYEVGTTTLKTIYSDSALTTAAPNPQIADSNGQFTGDMFLDGVYAVVHTDASDVTIWTKDPIGDVIEGQFELWLAGNTYNIPEIVLGSDDNYYKSKTDGNQGNDPTGSPANWTLIQFIEDEVIKLVSTPNAVNEITIANAATGNKPIISASGEANTGINLLDSNSNEIITLESTTSAINEITVANAASGNAPAITQTGTNNVGIDVEGVNINSAVVMPDAVTAKTLDLTLTATSTGYVKIAEGASVTGGQQGAVVILDDPIAIVVLSTTTGSWVTEDLTSISADMKMAIIQGIIRGTVAGAGAGTMELRGRRKGSSVAATSDTILKVAATDIGAASLLYSSAEFTVQVDVNDQIEWHMTIANITTPNTSLYCVGYYV